MVHNHHYVQMDNFTDAQLAGLVRNRDSNAFVELASRHLSLIKAKASHFHNAMLEADDLCQEGLMGLLNAARTYDPQGKASFRTYAGVCINNRIIMACRSAAGQKNAPLNNSVSLSDAEIDVQDHTTNPETVLIDNENFNIMRQLIEQSLTPLERSVFTLYVSGSGYRQIAQKLGIPSKSADNALQRVRFKLKKLFL